MYKKLLPLMAAMSLAGCVNLAPDFERPAAPVDQAWPTGEAYDASTIKSQALPSWQDFFADERLRKVIELGLANNRDLRVAALRVEQTRALYNVQRSELFPSVAASAQEAASRTSKFVTGTNATQHVYTAQAAMTSYELDFFGRVRNLNEQALQTFLQSEDAQRSAQSTLISEIAMAWLQLGADREQLKLQRETLASQEESFKLMEASYRIGSASQLDYEQARTTVASARAAIESYVRAVAQDTNALRVLVGEKVPEELLPEGIVDDATQEASMPADMPSEVLLKRPDVMSAERDLVSKNAAIGVARAAFFPSITLTAGIGTSSTDLSNLFNAGSGVWSFTPNVSLPIFMGGARLATLKAAKADQKIAVATYEKTLQTAFREVADALAMEGTVSKELSALTDLAEASTNAYNLAMSRYKSGVSTYLEVLDAQRQMVSAQQGVITGELARASSRVTLFKVLGGGTELAGEKSDAGRHD